MERVDVDPSRIELAEHAGVLVAMLCRGRGNALDLTTLRSLEALFAGMTRRGAPPIVLGGKGSAFCTGLDLHEAAGLDRLGMAALMHAFHKALTACFSYPGPTVAAVGGHAVAGGALLALSCDVRVIAEAGITFGIHGIHLGVSYPVVAMEILRAQLAEAQIQRVLYDGSRMAPEEASALEIVEEPVPAAQLVQHALHRARDLGALPKAAYAVTKLSVRGGAAQRLARFVGEGPMSKPAERWLDVWFSPRTQHLLSEARSSLGRSGPRPPDGASPIEGRAT